MGIADLRESLLCFKKTAAIAFEDLSFLSPHNERFWSNFLKNSCFCFPTIVIFDPDYVIGQQRWKLLSCPVIE